PRSIQPGYAQASGGKQVANVACSAGGALRRNNPHVISAAPARACRSRGEKRRRTDKGSALDGSQGRKAEKERNTGDADSGASDRSGIPTGAFLSGGRYPV